MPPLGGVLYGGIMVATSSRDSAFDWRGATPDEVDHEYSPSQHSQRPLPEYLAEYHALSSGHDAAALRKAGNPLLVYIHGGYWQKLSAADSLFNAVDAMAEDVSLHAVEYTIAPHASIVALVEEFVADVVRVVEVLAPSRVVLAGCSAGAHLGAMCARDSRVAPLLSGIVLLSGIYDLRPLIVTSINEVLGLDTERAELLSPLLLAHSAVVSDALLAVGEHESGEFIRQNSEYSDYLRRQRTRVDTIVVEHRDHFDLPYDLLKRGTLVGNWTLGTLGRD